jgi:hypothetical protein
MKFNFGHPIKKEVNCHFMRTLRKPEERPAW